MANSSKQVVTLSLRLPGNRRVGALAAFKRYEVEIDAPDLERPLVLSVEDEPGKGQLKVGGVPAGRNRVISVLGPSPGAPPLWAAVESLTGGYREVRLSPASTAVGRVWKRWLDLGRDDVAEATDPQVVLDYLSSLKSSENAAHFALLDVGRWAEDVARTGRMSSDSGGYATSPGRVDVTLQGVPDAVPAEIWVDDPVSPAQSGVSPATSFSGGRYRVSPVPPGEWTIWVSVPGLGIASRSQISSRPSGSSFRARASGTR